MAGAYFRRTGRDQSGFRHLGTTRHYNSISSSGPISPSTEISRAIRNLGYKTTRATGGAKADTKKTGLEAVVPQSDPTLPSDSRKKLTRSEKRAILYQLALECGLNLVKETESTERDPVGRAFEVIVEMGYTASIDS